MLPSGVKFITGVEVVLGVKTPENKIFKN